jgi:hypothetical protein
VKVSFVVCVSEYECAHAQLRPVELNRTMIKGRIDHNQEVPLNRIMYVSSTVICNKLRRIVVVLLSYLLVALGSVVG